MDNTKFAAFWEDTQKRNITLGIIGFTLLALIFKFVFLNDKPPVKRKKKVESYQKATVFNADDIKNIDEKALDKLYNSVATDLQKREKQIIREKRIMGEEMQKMQARMDEQELLAKKQASQMTQLIQGRLNNKEIADILIENGATTAVAGKSKSKNPRTRGSNDGSLPPLQQAGAAPNMIPIEQQNAAPRSAISGNVIRTISQNSVRQIHKSGEIKDTKYVKTYINESGQAIPIEDQTANTEQTNITTAEKEQKYVYLPAGSFFSAVMLTGLNAPTAMAADKSPMPVIFRIKKEAILPNNHRTDIRECHAVGEAVGDLATERANIRLVTISCITNTGESVEAGIQAVAVNDYDGIVGVSGTLITKNGNLLAGSMAASFMSSLAGAVAPRQVPKLSTDTNDAVYNPLTKDDLLNMGSTAVLGGASGAMDKLAEYYIELADAMHPVISIPPGRGVTFMVLKGTKLSLQLGEQNEQ